MDDVERRELVDDWFRRYADRVMAYLLHRTDLSTAEDVVQEVFIIAYRRAERIDEPVVGWLFGTARRVLANQRRSRSRADSLIDRIAQSAPAPVEGDAGGLERAFLDALAGLSLRDQEVLTLSCWYQLSTQEAATALGCSPKAYAVRLHRARGRLATHLQQSENPRQSPADLLTEALHD